MALMVYTVINPRLSDVATGVRRVIRYALTILIPITFAISLSSSVFYIIGQAQLYPLRLTTDAFFSMVLTGVLLFILYQPLSQFTRKVTNRLLFGQQYEPETVMREYSQAINHVISLEGLTAAIMALFQKAFETQRGTLLVMDAMDERGWYLKVLPGLGVPFGEPRLFLRKNSPLAQWFAENAEPLHQYFLDVDPRFQEQNSREMQEWRQLNMEVFLPIRRSDAVIGLIALGLRRAGRAYTTPELSLLQTLADQTGIALENATLFDGVQQRANQLTLLNEIGRVITTSLDLEPVMQLIAKRLENAFKGMTGFIFLADETHQDLVLNTVFGTKRTLTSALRVGPGRGLVGWVAQHGQPVLAYDLQADSRYDSQVEGFLVPKGRAALCVPVRAQNQIIGVILLVDASRTSLGPAELSLLDSIASFASIAISNARQVAAREALLRRQVESLRIEVDELKREQHVEEIVSTEFFQGLRQRASQLRRRPPAPDENPSPGDQP
jgi:GAF domain-containing protein